jgi:multidrug efflux pump subunit AcrA (membrane-fusion protein)
MARNVRERGMNAALASGEAGVGEIKPAKAPMKLRQLLAALLVAVLGAGLGLFSYRALASTPPSFTGEVTPANTYYLDFAATGLVETLAVRPGDRVKAGQILATQDNAVAAANLAASQATVAADEAIIAEDQAPQTSATAAAQNQLDVSKAQTAVQSAQGALDLARTDGQNLVNGQQGVITDDQKTLSDDTASYAQYCSPGATQSPPANPGPGSSPTPTPSTSTSPPVSQVELCRNLASQVDRDSTELARAQADLQSAESANQAQQQQDDSNLTASQSVLASAQAVVASQGAALTPAVIAQAQSQLAQAKAQVAADQVTLRQTTITAPVDGIVAETAGSVGDIAGADGVHNYAGPAGQAGTEANQQSNIQLFSTNGSPSGGSNQAGAYSALVTMYSGGLNVTAQLPESTMAGVHVGQNATLAIAAAGVSVPGRISEIVMVPATVAGSTYYDVTISMSTKSPGVMAGMSVTVSLS